jgi:3-deoxy-D-manno-octulosonic-acid transferase
MGETPILSVGLRRGQSAPKLIITQPFTAVYSLYSVLIVTFFLVMSPYLAWQAVRHRKVHRQPGPAAWAICPCRSTWTARNRSGFHAVSVGEVLTARRAPAAAQGSATRASPVPVDDDDDGAADRAQQPAVRGRGLLLPFDLGFVVNRTLRLVKPRMFIMMETEIWPNLLRACRRNGIKTVLVNGRISSRSYPRYRLARPFFRRVLTNVDRFCMQGRNRRGESSRWAPTPTRWSSPAA